MTDKSLKKLSSSKKKQRKNAVNEHEPERFAPCAFVLEKFLKEYRRTKMGSHTWKTSQHGDAKEQE
ncbi:hypothetical protein IHJ32_004837 [Escherichia coli]|uniref:Uncharacterized protein n=1 Tax=Escherichia coli O121 TaxID=1055537 RepID=A0AAP9MSV7_ECOLX|nr:hypothetical protein [Escherichia coli]EFW8101657.1 hypothetical protein [Shigella sonnei]AUF75353.1 hypothetical protein CGC46_04810 [Escherichia coli O121:H19]AWJ29658.1 hypothetical protein I3S_25775 [Escherichia coli O121 str. RM8352]EEC9378565.1 hypothetical protein [Escherichia coli]EEC9599786.1 hypothetical protein [Escherichia coli]